MYAWSQNTDSLCRAPFERHYPLNKAGIWADSVRLSHSVIHNDYVVETGKNGLPVGHVPIKRHMSVPVIDISGKIKIIAGVVNKIEPYTKEANGIPPDCAEHVFQLFFTTKPSGKGTGLGLTICASLAKDMGGDIRFETRYKTPNEGTTFILTLLRSQAMSTPTVVQQTGKVTISGNCMVVDDERELGYIIKESLDLLGLVTDVEESAESAFVALGKKKYQFLITDYKLSGAAGTKIIEKAKTLYGDSCQFILMSGYLSIEGGGNQVFPIIDPCADVYFFNKPFSIESLEQVVLGLYKAIHNRASVNCWEFMKCGREAGGERAAQFGVCVAYPDYGQTCASIAGTFCKGTKSGFFASKIKTCMECAFFQTQYSYPKSQFPCPGSELCTR